MPQVETWDGTSWTEVAELNNNRKLASIFGLTGDAVTNATGSNPTTNNQPIVNNGMNLAGLK